MADTQKVYPANEDVEKSPPPSAPLAPRSSLASEKGDPNDASKKNHVQVIFPKDQVIPPRTAPRYYSRPPKRRNPCCRCIAWTFCFLFLLIVAIVVAAGILYLVFQPRIPKYTVENIQITGFSVNQSDFSVSSQFGVDVRARNPNKKIGIYYLGDSYIAVFYTGTELCRGSLPAFYQGHKNTTNMNVTLTGKNVQITTAMVSALQTQQTEGSIPLRLKADVPVKVKFGKLKTMKITFRVRCDLVVDTLQANANVNISTKKCKVRL